jgi:cysteine desulfurase/selenocysteine lyase
MHRYGLSGSARASFSIYNTLDEIELLFNGIEKAKMMLE